MNVAELADKIAALAPSDMAQLFAAVAERMSSRAEALYDANSEENGILAQPYANLADLLDEASGVFNQGPVDIQTVANKVEGSVSELVSKRLQGTPWGKY